MAHRKKILFISTTYFGYYLQIMQVLENQGFEVQYFYDDPLQSFSLHHLRHRLPQRLINILSATYKKKVIKDIRKNKYDALFVIRGEFVDAALLNEFKTQNPEAPCLMYQWDSLKNFNFNPIVPLFDKVFSFDPVDCRQHNFNYVPLFALDEFFQVRELKKQTQQDIDLLFVGYNHGSRLSVVREFKKSFAGTGIIMQAYLYTPMLMFLRNILSNTKKFKAAEVTTRKISRPAFKQLLARSKVVLDVQSPTQSGLTIRTFEVLAAGGHLLTTNRSILQEPFFDKRYITVFNMEDIHTEQFKLPPVETDSELDFSQYALSSWIKNFTTII